MSRQIRASSLHGLVLAGWAALRQSGWLPLVCAFVLAAPAWAAQPSAELIAALTAAERRAGDAALSPGQRERAMDRAIDLRRELIAAARENDEHLPGWLLDQAAAKLSRLARDGSDTAVLFGIPLSSQREASLAAAAGADELLQRADRLLEQRGRSQEEDQNRSVRIPFFRARAKLLLAAGTDGDEQHRLAAEAHAMIGRLSLTVTRAEAARRVNLARALLLRDDAPADAQLALDELGWVLTRAAEDGEAVPPLAHAEAWMCLLHAAGTLVRIDAVRGRFDDALRGPPFVRDGEPDPLLIVLATDALSRGLQQQAIRSGDAAYLDDATVAQARLLHRDNLPIGPRAMAPLVYEKLAALADQTRLEAPGLQLPHGMQVARAVILSRAPEHRDKAIAILQAVRGSSAICPYFTPDALWELAVLLTQPGAVADDERLEAAQVLTQLAGEFPGHRRASEAMEAALAFGRTLAQARSEGDPGSGSTNSALRTYFLALQTAVAGYPQLNRIEFWRFEHARVTLNRHLAAESLQDPAAIDGEFAAALKSLEAIASEHDLHDDARSLAERLHRARLDLWWEQFRTKRRSADAQAAATLAQRAILPAAHEAVAWARSARADVLTRFRADLADALLEADEGDPRRLYEANLRAVEHTPELRFLLSRTQLGLARTLHAQGETPRAFTLLRTVAQSLEPRVQASRDRDEADPATDRFWHAWALMAEILSESAQTPDSAASLGVHIRRLKTLDPELGGSPWKERILAAQARASRDQ